MKYKQLFQVAKWRTARIDNNSVTYGNYISTENMLPNRDGIENIDAKFLYYVLSDNNF